MPKIDKVEYEKRVRIVQEWILEDQTYTDMMNGIMAKWGIEERQAKKYIAEARNRWANDTDLVLDQQRRLKIEGLRKLKRGLKEVYKGTPRGIEAILKIDKEISKLQGLYPASKVELTGKDGQPLVPPAKLDVKNLSKDELKTIMELAKKAKSDK